MSSFVSFLLLLVTTVNSKEVKLPDEVRVALESQERSIQNLTICWTEKLIPLRPMEEVLKLAELPQDYSALEHLQRFAHTRQGKKFYQEERIACQVPPESPYIENCRCGYDGAYFFEVSECTDLDSTRVSYPLGAVWPLDYARTEGRPTLSFVAKVFEANGFWLPEHASDLDLAPSPLPLRLLREKARLISVEITGDLVLQFESESWRHSFTLDKKLGYAVVHWQKRSAVHGDLLVSVKNQDFKAVAGTTLWLPAVSVLSWHRWEDTFNVLLDPAKRCEETPYLEQRIEIEEVTTRPLPDEVFTLRLEDLRPEAYIRDARFPGAANAKDGFVHVVIPDTKEELTRLLQELKKGNSAGGRRESEVSAEARICRD